MINLKDIEKEIILNYLSGPKVITKVLDERGREWEKRKRRRNDREVKSE